MDEHPECQAGGVEKQDGGSRQGEVPPEVKELHIRADAVNQRILNVHKKKKVPKRRQREQEGQKRPNKRFEFFYKQNKIKWRKKKERNL